MKLYHYRLPAPNPRRVRIFLAEKGLSLPLEEVPMHKRSHKAPEFLEKNSLGQLPVLELDDGTTLCESISICRYLEELHPEPALFGSTALERARIDMWNRRIEFSVMNPVAAVWIHTHPLTAAITRQFKDYGEASKDRVTGALQWLDGELAAREFIAGDDYSIADIVALTTIDFAKFIGLEVPAQCANVLAWHQRVSARPSAAA
jgi:glutathione S-transferase